MDKTFANLENFSREQFCGLTWTRSSFMEPVRSKTKVNEVMPGGGTSSMLEGTVRFRRRSTLLAS